MEAIMRAMQIICQTEGEDEVAIHCTQVDRKRPRWRASLRSGGFPLFDSTTGERCLEGYGATQMLAVEALDKMCAEFFPKEEPPAAVPKRVPSDALLNALVVYARKWYDYRTGAFMNAYSPTREGCDSTAALGTDQWHAELSSEADGLVDIFVRGGTIYQVSVGSGEVRKL